MSSTSKNTNIKGQFGSVCLDPFGLHPGKYKRKGLRTITTEKCEQFPLMNFNSYQKLCRQCFDMLNKSSRYISRFDSGENSSTSENNAAVDIVESDNVSDLYQFNTDSESEKIEEYELNVINTSLQLIGESPVTKRKMSSKKYPQEKVARVCSNVAKRLKVDQTAETPQLTMKQKADNFDVMLEQYQAKFNRATRSEKVSILTAMPSSWSIRKLAGAFNTTYHLAKTSKNLQAQEGCLSNPNRKAGRPLNEQVVASVKDFFLREDISRTLPGKRDYVSIKTVGSERIHAQKRLVLCNLKEAYQQFKSENPSTKLGFSKFAEFRPKQCVLAGSSGTHSVCVCQIHQNTKLMIQGAQLHQLADVDEVPIKTYHHALAKMTCNPPSQQCLLRQCEECINRVDQFIDYLGEKFEEKAIDQIEYRK